MNDDRRCRAQQLFAAQKLTTILLSDLNDIRYLSGYNNGDAVLVLHHGKLFLFTDARYREDAEKSVKQCRVKIIKKTLLEEVANFLRKLKCKKLGVQASSLTLSFANKLGEQKIALIPLAADFANWRQQKTPAEIAQIKQAINIAQTAFMQLRPRIKIGMSELAVKAELEYLALRAGANAMSFPTIIASGANASSPHAQATTRQLRASEPLLIDFGVLVNGYASDLTRVLFIDKIPPFWRKNYQAVLAAQLAGIAKIKAGVSGKIPEMAARKILRQYNLEKYFVHSLGHGIGLKVHEAPRMAQKSKNILLENSVVTVEPGVYFPRRGGIRIEDDVLVTKTGAQVLSTLPKNIDAIII